MLKLLLTEYNLYKAIEVAGVPLILVGPSGENTGHVTIQVWEKSMVLPRDKEMKRGRAFVAEGRRMLFVILSCLFILENILVSRVYSR